MDNRDITVLVLVCAEHFPFLKVSRLALGHMPTSYATGTAKAEDEWSYTSTTHMPSWCAQGQPYLQLTFTHFEILRLIMITYLRGRGKKLGYFHALMKGIWKTKPYSYKIRSHSFKVQLLLVMKRQPV
jgi:hypothetical protein